MPSLQFINNTGTNIGKTDERGEGGSVSARSEQILIDLPKVRLLGLQWVAGSVWPFGKDERY